MVATERGMSQNLGRMIADAVRSWARRGSKNERPKAKVQSPKSSEKYVESDKPSVVEKTLLVPKQGETLKRSDVNSPKILEQVVIDSKIPNGEKLIEALRSAPEGARTNGVVGEILKTMLLDPSPDIIGRLKYLGKDLARALHEDGVTDDVFRSIGSSIGGLIYDKAKIVYAGRKDLLWDVEEAIGPLIGSGLMHRPPGPPAGGPPAYERAMSVGLTEYELQELRDDPVEFFQKRWDEIDVEKVQNPLDSETERMERLFDLAQRELEGLVSQGYVAPEKHEKVKTVNTIRKSLIMFKHQLISKEDMEGAVAIAGALGSEGLYGAFNMLGGGVRIAYNRLQQLTTRLRFDHNNNIDFGGLNLEVIPGVKRELIEEATRGALLNERGENVFGNSPEEVEKNVNRSVKIAWNTFLATQRLAVQVSMGTTAEGARGIVSDPMGWLATLYKITDLHLLKWGLLDEAGVKIIETIFKIAGKGNEALGQKRIGDVLALPDYFSSWWRDTEVIDTLDLRYGNNGGWFALGMRLVRYGHLKETDPTRDTLLRDTWEKIAKVRPLEIARIYKDKAMTIQKDVHADDGSFQDLIHANPVFANLGIHNFQEAEKILGKYIYPLYEKMNFEKRPIDFDHLSPGEVNIINRLRGNANQVSEAMGLLTNWSNSKTDELLVDDDVYRRAWFVDDIIPDDMDKEGNLVGGRHGKLHMSYSIGGTNDPFPRSYKDHKAAMGARNNIVGYLNERDIKILKKAQEDIKAYKSPKDAEEIGSVFAEGWLKFIEKNKFFDWLGIDIPLVPMSEAEKLFGKVGADFGIEELNALLEQYRVMGIINKETEAKIRESVGAQEGLVALHKFRTLMIILFLLLLSEGLEQLKKD